MKFLFIVRQKKNVDSFRTTLIRLLDEGHEIRLAIQERDPERDEKLREEFSSPGFSLVASPALRSDDWRLHAPLVRSVRDWVQYLGPRYAQAGKLRQRVVDKLRLELDAHGTSMGSGIVPGLGPVQIDRIRSALQRIEDAIPSDPLFEEFVARDRPDAVIVTPGVQFGSAQADFIKASKAAGIPVWTIVFSWDNLSTKGALHVMPDRMFVWNERQRREAAELHGFPSERVVVVGAPRFDEFFALKRAVTRTKFFKPIGLDPQAATILYVCSSKLVSGREIDFIRRWLAALRESEDPAIRSANVIVRPHPDVPTITDDTPETIRWPQLPRALGYLSRPFADTRAVVLRTTYGTLQAFFECLYHAAAVVGLNTSAELEAGIVGRPVLTIVSDDDAVEGQATTLHFHYLLRENGGFVISAPDLGTHVRQLSDVLASPPDGKAIRQFVREFLRPAGAPAAHVLADALVTQASNGKADSGSAVSVDRRPVIPAIVTRDEADPGQDGESEKALRVGYAESQLRIIASPETRRWRRDGTALLDETTVRWLDEQVQPGDVVFDIGAGVGVYALIAARHRGALTVAFEPGFATFKRLCENIIRNDCRRSVIPLAIVLGDCNGLFEIEYRSENIGEGWHAVAERPWDFRRLDASEPHYIQPVGLERLDDVVQRYGLPRPNHVRVAVTQGSDRVIAGGGKLWSDSRLRSVLVATGSGESEERLTRALDRPGMRLVGRQLTDRTQVLLFNRVQAVAGLAARFRM